MVFNKKASQIYKTAGTVFVEVFLGGTVFVMSITSHVITKLSIILA